MNEHEMIAVVEDYIYQKKGKKVKIVIQSGRDVILLNIAYQHAIKHEKEADKGSN